MKIYDYILLTTQEIPWMLHTSFYVAGCTRNCPECSWNTAEFSKEKPYELTEELYRKVLNKTRDWIKGVVFLGGEWDEPNLVKFLKIAIKEYGYETCLYTGCDTIEEIPKGILDNLTYIKIGHYDKDLGPLTSKTTNQRFIRLSDNHCFNEEFYDKEELA